VHQLARSSTTDADARLARKSGEHEAKLAYCGNVLIENRNGLVVDTELLQCSGTAERDAAMLMAERIEGDERVMLAADKRYDTKDFVKEMRHMNVTPHVSQNDRRPGGSAIDGRTTRHAGYKVSQQKRKQIEEVFGWLKTVGALRKMRLRGLFKVGWSSRSRRLLTTWCGYGICCPRRFKKYKPGEKCVRMPENRAFGHKSRGAVSRTHFKDHERQAVALQTAKSARRCSPKLCQSLSGSTHVDFGPTLMADYLAAHTRSR
jgi:DDE family transposase